MAKTTTETTGYEVRDGRLVTAGEAVSVRRTVVRAVLERARRPLVDGPVPIALVERMLQLERLLSLTELTQLLRRAA